MAARKLVAEIDEVVQALGKRRLSDESIHLARKAIKKARAALRLLRQGIGDGIYKLENAALRDAGRCLSPLRDAKSLADAFGVFREMHSAQLQHAAYDSLAEHLHAKLLAQHRELVR